MIASVIEALRASGLRNDGTPLDTASTPDSATAPDEKARSSIIKPSALRAFAELACLLGEVLEGDRPEVLDEDAVAADHDQQDQHQDVEVRRRCEERAGFSEAAQVGDRHDHDHQQAQRDAPLAAEAERRLDGEHPPATDTATVRM